MSDAPRARSQSTSARVQFLRVGPSEATRMTAWIHHISRLTGAPLAVAAHQPIVLWQLTAANHRVLARCAVAFDSIDEAHDDVASVVEARERLTSRMVRVDATRLYGWALLDGGRPVLACARWYTMERDRRESLRMARLGLDLLSAASERHADFPVTVTEGQ